LNGVFLRKLVGSTAQDYTFKLNTNYDLIISFANYPTSADTATVGLPNFPSEKVTV
jgi:hypothetical protein